MQGFKFWWWRWVTEPQSSFSTLFSATDLTPVPFPEGLVPSLPAQLSLGLFHPCPRAVFCPGAHVGSGIGVGTPHKCPCRGSLRMS